MILEAEMWAVIPEFADASGVVEVLVAVEFDSEEHEEKFFPPKKDPTVWASPR
jgi:hypothetical protein